jgi:hypothetical protein
LDHCWNLHRCGSAAGCGLAAVEAEEVQTGLADQEGGAQETTGEEAQQEEAEIISDQTWINGGTMGILSILFGRREKPININDASNHHMDIALTAHFEAERASERGSVATRHLRDIAIRHVTISQRLDELLDANERSMDGS